MSRKWQQVKRWDDAHLTGPLLPVKWLLRLLSSIVFGVVLLVLVALYGALASLPVGLLLEGLTWGLYLLTLALVAGAFLSAGVLGAVALTRRAVRPWRFAAVVAAVVVFGAAGAMVWHQWVWPWLHYDPITGQGVRVLGSLADRYADVTLRRLPMFEMTEAEFYAWWPLRLVLILFVLTMIVSTVRRIAFTLENLGVLMVHTGIIILGLGSLYYGAMKVEGDVLLLAGQPGRDGLPTEGPAQRGFYDRTQVALWINQGRGWDQRLLQGVPRYNAANLNAGLDESALQAVGVLGDLQDLQARDRLDLPVPPSPGGVSDADVSYRVVGYAPYAQPQQDWVRDQPQPGRPATALRFVELYSRVPIEGRAADDGRPVFRFFFVPSRPRLRLAQMPLLAIEYRMSMDEQAWQEATAPVPAGAEHALVVTLPGEDVPRVLAVREGQRLEVGSLTLEVQQLLPEPPFAIITEGYENASSSVAIVRITDGQQSRTRWIYSRFPEISQDLFEGQQADGRPQRQPADESIVRIRYLDLTAVHVLFDERPDGLARVAVREPGRGVRVLEGVGQGQPVTLLEAIDLVRSGGWPHARQVLRPVPVPKAEQDGQLVGTHERAMLAVEVRVGDWSQVVWLPFIKYLNVGQQEARELELPDGRRVRLAFGRARRALPGFQLRLVDFEMVAYDHRGAPRDYRSIVRVEPTSPQRQFEPYVGTTQLNAPLRAPFVWSEGRSWLANAAGYVVSRLDPTQFKLAQAGWDAQGWQRTQAMADQGLIPEPYAQFSILLVANNPGIHVIALGGVLMALGTPWAFYVKPWMVRRRSARLAAEHARGQHRQPWKESA
ncbi:MAG: hypothetical protein KatS3mg103_1382 [Phycisphaerales bacterium]|nr:MAG: hypothetical protein KatS3mg103_1382 [Phycisphaerales bacterium]